MGLEAKRGLRPSRLPLVLLPALDLVLGRVWVRGGGKSSYLDPVRTARNLVDGGARWLHVVDIDRVRGSGCNLAVIRELMKALPGWVRVQISGGIVDSKALDELLELRAARYNLAANALLDFDWVKGLIKRLGPKIALSLDVEEDRVCSRISNLEVGNLVEWVQRLSDASCRVLVVTDNRRDGRLSGPNFELLSRVASLTPSKIIASGGVADIDDIRRLRELGGLSGAVVGSAFLTGRFSIGEALKAAGLQTAFEAPSHIRAQALGGLAPADTAGVAFSGRKALKSLYANDSGETPEALASALSRYKQGLISRAEVLDILAGERVLMPLLVVAGGGENSSLALAEDKIQEISVASVSSPDGRLVMPAFTGILELGAWRDNCRPLPIALPKAALAALSEGVELMIINPASPERFLLRRPMLYALAQGKAWQPADTNRAVYDALVEVVADLSVIEEFRLLSPKGPDDILEPELVIELRLAPGLSQEQLVRLQQTVSMRLAQKEAVVSGVDSIRLSLRATR